MGGQRIKNPLGVIQGRLLPKYNGRYQAHPVGYWQDEFLIAAALDLDCIEFILDSNDAEQNPLLTESGQNEIGTLSQHTGVDVLSVCADYLMQAPLHSKDKTAAKKGHSILLKLLDAASKLGIKDIVIPCVDESSIQNSELRERFIKILKEFIPEAELKHVNLSLETDLNPSQFSQLLDRLNSKRVTVNYDIGNSGALGYDFREELSAYGDRISDIHIKDRRYGGDSVKLGTGNADIQGFFKLIQKFDYTGPFIMQAYRDDNGVEIFKEQLNWLKNIELIS